MGLGHLGNYNKVIDFDNDAVFKNDSKNLSIMSYVNPATNPYIDEPNYNGFESNNMTGMVADYLAIDDLYSQFGYGSSQAFQGDTTYGFNTTITSDVARAVRP